MLPTLPITERNEINRSRAILDHSGDNVTGETLSLPCLFVFEVNDNDVREYKLSSVAFDIVVTVSPTDATFSINIVDIVEFIMMLLLYMSNKIID